MIPNGHYLIAHHYKFAFNKTDATQGNDILSMHPAKAEWRQQDLHFYDGGLQEIILRICFDQTIFTRCFQQNDLIEINPDYLVLVGYEYILSHG